MNPVDEDEDFIVVEEPQTNPELENASVPTTPVATTQTPSAPVQLNGTNDISILIYSQS
jgi:hypothetical protein